MNTTWLYKDGPDGLLCAMALIWEGRPAPDAIAAISRHSPDLFSNEESIPSDSHTAANFLKKLERETNRTIRNRVMYAACSGIGGFEKSLCDYIVLLRDRGLVVDGNFSHPAVAQVQRTGRQVAGEAHRLKGLVRFRELSTGLLWAPLSPDHHVLPFVAGHFRRRMPAANWVLHDVKRNEAILWDGQRLIPAIPDDRLKEVSSIKDDVSLPLSPAEKECAEYWRTFFKTIAVPGRTNPGLQRSNMPRRYWTWLVEKQ